MASTLIYLIIFSYILFSIIANFTLTQQTSFKPKSLLLPVTKHPSSLQYITHIFQRTPSIPLTLVLDLGGQNLWVDCEHYVSSTYRTTLCNSLQCSLAGSNFCMTRPGSYNNNTCVSFHVNTITRASNYGQLGCDVVSIQSNQRFFSVNNFVFTCGARFLLHGLANGVIGMAGLGRSRISLPLQFSTAFSFGRTFGLCLGSSNGVVFFGDVGSNVVLPGIDVSKSLVYTPLILNKEGDLSSEYFIGVENIKINNKILPINRSLLSINNEGYGGTKISTISAYTVMETTIYNAVVNAFVKEIGNVPRVASIPPFKVCFDATKIGNVRTGPAVPVIDLVLQSNMVYWRIFGANSMVKFGNDVLCLGFVDGGVNPKTSIVIGGHQLEDNLLEFDLATSRLGFGSSLLLKQTSCANFSLTFKV